MASLLQYKQRFWNNDGAVNSGGWVYIYESGTTTPKTTYTTAAATVQHTHPIELNSKGEPKNGDGIFTTGTFKVNVTDVNFVQITGFPVDGLGDVLGSSIHSATAKTTPVDADEVSIWDSVTQVAQKVTWANVKATLLTTWKDATGGLVGMTLFKINFKNAANTFTSFFTNTNTAARTYMFQNRDGTIADDTDLAAKAALAGSASQAFSMTTAAQGTNTTQGASTAFALAEFGHHDNLCLNGGFTINQTGYVSAATLAAGSYGHDQWKAGASGGDYSFTQLASNTQITIATGKTLIQIIEASHVQFTSYWLVWEGTAQARYAVNSSTPAGSYAASPIQITGQTVGTKFSIEFNAGTLGKVELSNTPHTNERMTEQELALCQRYFWREKASSAYYLFGLCWTADVNTAYAIGRHPVPMYSTPSGVLQDGTATDYGIYTNAGYVCSAVPVINTSTNTVQFLISLTFAGTLTADQVGFFRSNNNTNAYIGFEARLT